MSEINIDAGIKKLDYYTGQQDGNIGKVSYNQMRSVLLAMKQPVSSKEAGKCFHNVSLNEHCCACREIEEQIRTKPDYKSLYEEAVELLRLVDNNMGIRCGTCLHFRANKCQYKNPSINDKDVCYRFEKRKANP